MEVAPGTMIPVLFEDDDVIAVHKPEGLASISERVAGMENVLSLLSTHRGKKLYVVHRLDKEVSGVILFAKNAASHRWLNHQFSQWIVLKTYAALVHGVIEGDRGVVERPLRQFGSGRMGIDPARGKPSITEFLITERFRSHTALRVFPRTGRRHQIRVHFYSMGHPVVGDSRYGDRALQERFPRLMLHAERITVVLPSGREVTVEAPFPESFRTVLERVRSECTVLG